MIKFVILTQPRCRSKWLSEYLHCGHDLILGCSSIDEYIDKSNSYLGTIETSVAFAFRLWKKLFPEAKFVTITRPIHEIGDSFRKHGYMPDWSFLLAQDSILKSLNDCMKLSYSDLDCLETRINLCHYLGAKFDLLWDREMRDKRIEIDFEQRTKDISQNRFQLSAFAADILRRI